MQVVIDGKTYKPSSENKNISIGIGITTRNRNQLVAETYAKIKSLTPDAKIVVVDDASNTPVDMDAIVYRFDSNVGIAKAKNKCLELLADCEHIFLFDDDAYPLVYEWYMPYVTSPEHHLMYIFKDLATNRKLNDITVVYEDEQHIGYSGARGVMLYIDKYALDTVGGMDEEFGKWGWEHPAWSRRVYNRGLCSSPFTDVKGSEQLIYSMDEHEQVERSVSAYDRAKIAQSNIELYRLKYFDSHYIEFREMRNVVLSCLFTTKIDPQRNNHMQASESMVKAMHDSLNGRELVLFTDELETEYSHKTIVTEQPYFQRWVTYLNYLKANKDIAYAWCIDATDVELLGEPFNGLEAGKLYIGSEHKLVGDDWMMAHHQSKKLQSFMDGNRNQLLNAGLVGGDRKTLIDFLTHLVHLYIDNKIDVWHGKDKDLGVGDMAALNYVAYTYFMDRLVFGPQINTIFKSEQRNGFSIWKHK